jgi:hypothetical protein
MQYQSPDQTGPAVLPPPGRYEAALLAHKLRNTRANTSAIVTAAIIGKQRLILRPLRSTNAFTLAPRHRRSRTPPVAFAFNHKASVRIEAEVSQDRGIEIPHAFRLKAPCTTREYALESRGKRSLPRIN